MDRLCVPRSIACGTLAVLLAVLVTGLAPPPAQAADNHKAQVERANQYIFDCFSTDGDPDVYVNDTSGSVTVTCGYDEGATYCVFKPDGTTDCGHSTDRKHPKPLVGGHLPDRGTWLIVTDPVIDTGGALPPRVADWPTAAEPLAVERPRHGMAATTDQEQEQDQNQEQRTRKSTGKKDGKGRRK